MMLTTTDVDRIATAIHALRPGWAWNSLVTFINRQPELLDRAPRDVAIALTWIAHDPTTDTPKLVLQPGPWWDAATTRTGTPTPTPRAPRCPHQVLEGHCRNCNPISDPEARAAAIAAARAAIRRQ